MAKTGQGAETRERILRVAETLFANLGYDGASMRRLASEAGVSVQTMVYHCGNKMDLYNEVLERSVIPVTEIMNHKMQKFLADGPRDEKETMQAIDGVVDELFDALRDNPNYPLLFIRQVLERDPDVRNVERQKWRPFFEDWSAKLGDRSGGEALRGLLMRLVCLPWIYWGLFANIEFEEILEVDPASPEGMNRLKECAKEITFRMVGRRTGGSGST